MLRVRCPLKWAARGDKRQDTTQKNTALLYARAPTTLKRYAITRRQRILCIILLHGEVIAFENLESQCIKVGSTVSANSICTACCVTNIN